MAQWTWAATILQSSNVAWQYGVSGPFWYASGATVQASSYIQLNFSQKKKFTCFRIHSASANLGALVRGYGHRDQKAPHAHTVCEIVRARCVASLLSLPWLPLLSKTENKTSDD
ncbi:hypothetical protein SAY86_023583 [Trapa natans]|uniref:Uncharacterized protein n=1 Tax=Trapa natans TaxID=22666 RepID=A0AAN7M7Y8_TRANT|nr:hypothetical protein SAY86_023583 [Trapa natans]